MSLHPEIRIAGEVRLGSNMPLMMSTIPGFGITLVDSKIRIKCGASSSTRGSGSIAYMNSSGTGWRVPPWNHMFHCKLCCHASVAVTGGAHSFQVFGVGLGFSRKMKRLPRIS